MKYYNPPGLSYVFIGIKKIDEIIEVIILSKEDVDKNQIDVKMMDFSGYFFNPKLLDYLYYIKNKLARNTITIKLIEYPTVEALLNENFVATIEHKCKLKFPSISTEMGMVMTEFIEFVHTKINFSEILQMYCKSHNVSLYHIRSISKRLIGVKPKELIIALKIDKSCELLINTSLTIKSIALELGFEEPSYFIKVFKTILNETPTTFRMRSIID